MLLPTFTGITIISGLYGWFYTIGSLAFVLTDTTEWLHYVYLDCRFMLLSLNFYLNVIGSLIYLLGSICYTPQLNMADLGTDCFLVGSYIIVFSQFCKELKIVINEKKTNYETSLF